MRRVAILATVSVIAGVLASASGVVNARHPGHVARAAADPAPNFVWHVTTMEGGGSSHAAEQDGTGVGGGSGNAWFDTPELVRLSTDGKTLYVLDNGNTGGVQAVRKIALDADGLGGSVTTLASTATTLDPDISGLAVDGSGNVYVSAYDPHNSTVSVPAREIEKITPSGTVSVLVSDIPDNGYNGVAASLAVDPSSMDIYFDAYPTTSGSSDLSDLYRAPLSAGGAAFSLVATDLVGLPITYDGEISDMQFVTTPGANAGKLLLDWGQRSGSNYLWTWNIVSGLQEVEDSYSVGPHIAQSPAGNDFVGTDNGRWLMDFPGGPNDSPLGTIGAFQYQYLSSSSQWDSWSGISQSFTDLTDSGMVWASSGLQDGDVIYVADAGSDAIRAIQAYPPGFKASELIGGSNPSELCWRCLLGEPVGSDQGDAIESASDLTVATRGPALAVTRSYDSSEASVNSPYGYGWTGSYAMSAVTDSWGDWTINQENGSTVTFYPSTTGGFTAQPRVLGRPRRQR